MFLQLLLATTVFSAPLLTTRNTRPFQAESTMEALEPWETPVDGFFIRSHHEVPTVDEKSWVLEISGLVEKPLKLRLSDLRKRKMKSFHAVLECAGNGRGLQRPRVPGLQWQRGAVGNGEWTGISLAELLKEARLQPGAKFVTVEGADKPAVPSVPAFVRSIPLEKILEPDTILAVKMNREEMPLLHGGPLRLILPRWYGQNWIKWVTKLTVTAEEDQGFYMKKGYRMPKTPLKAGAAWDSATGNPVGQIRVQSLITSPRSGQLVPAGKVPIKGKAFSGAGAIKSVEVSTDGGGLWLPAKVAPVKGSGSWQEFEAVVDLEKEGSFTVMAKATDSSGASQPMEQEWNPPGYLRNDVDRVVVTVEKDPQISLGKTVAEEKCLMCHSSEMLETQRLTPEQWDKVISKMQGFGAALNPEERAPLLKYLAGFTADQPDSYSPPTSFAPAEKNFRPLIKGNKGQGKKLYAQNCATCHGGVGEGKTGPRLMGKAIPDQDFLSAVLSGKRSMPSFEASLSQKAVGDIRAYLK